MCDYREYEKMPVNSNYGDKETTIYHLVDLKELFQHCDPDSCNNNSIKDEQDFASVWSLGVFVLLEK